MTAIARRRALGLIGLGLTALALSGCGRKGRPEESEEAVYPHLYPFTPYPGAPVPPPQPPQQSSPPADPDAPLPAETTDLPR